MATAAIPFSKQFSGVDIPSSRAEASCVSTNACWLRRDLCEGRAQRRCFWGPTALAAERIFLLCFEPLTVKSVLVPWKSDSQIE